MIISRKKRELAERLAAAALRGYFRAGETSFRDMQSEASALATKNVLKELEKFMDEMGDSKPSEPDVKKKMNNGGLYG